MRSPYPLKSARTLHGDEDVARARRAIASDPTAAAILDEMVHWVERWAQLSDEEILRRIPPPSMPRAYEVGRHGCPICGETIFQHGMYPWRFDEEDFYRVICPVCGTRFPGNDVARGLRYGFDDPVERAKPYFDDGWGWIAPDGRRYWFAAHACERHWRRVLDQVLLLSRAYLLTGEARFAHVATVILAAIADRYPQFDYCSQSRRGVEFREKYWGKILNYVEETRSLCKLAEAYDNVWETIDRDRALQELRGQTGEEIRDLIEANILEEGIREVWTRNICGNYGMHQLALATAAIVRQNGPTREWIEKILDPDVRPNSLYEGIRYAMYNYISRDGMPNEVSPGYNAVWPTSLYPVFEVLRRAKMPVEEYEPRLRDMALAPLELIVLDRFTPDQGDSGDPYGGICVPSDEVYLDAFHRYGDPLVRRWVRRRHLLDRYTDYASLFREREPLPEGPDPDLPPVRVLDGYGGAIMESTDKSWGVFMYYGHIRGHSHRDCLNFDLFAHGQKMMPDLGYPDQTDGYTSGRMSWTSNTIAHNCVMVDRSQPRGFGPAELRRLVVADGFRIMDADAASRVYHQTRTYRRVLTMVETGPGEGYLVDIFRVHGGEEHHYSLHGPPGEVIEVSGQWSQPLPGTLAGREVPVGMLYDRPVMCQPDYKGTFYDYHGSGFSHFVRVRLLEKGPCTLQYRHIRDSRARLALHILPESERDTVITAEAHASPLRFKEMVRYAIVQRMRKTDDPLTSTFVAVCEPFSERPVVTSVERCDTANGVAIVVHRGTERDVILYRLDGSGPMEVGGIRTDADAAYVAFSSGGAPWRVCFADGNEVVVNGLRIARETAGAKFSAGLRGRVVSVSPSQGRVLIRPERPVNPSGLVGTYPAFWHDGRVNRHRVVAAQDTPAGIALTLGDSVIIGRGRTTCVEGRQVHTGTLVGFVPGIFRGARLTNGSFERFLGVASVSLSCGRHGEPADRTTVTLLEPAPDGFLHDGDDFWLCTFGPDAEVRLESLVEWTSPAEMQQGKPHQL